LLGGDHPARRIAQELAGVGSERLLAKVTLGAPVTRSLALGKSLERIPLLKQKVTDRQSGRLKPSAPRSTTFLKRTSASPPHRR
jgi:hypothetical protein